MNKETLTIWETFGLIVFVVVVGAIGYGTVIAVTYLPSRHFGWANDWKDYGLMMLGLLALAFIYFLLYGKMVERKERRTKDARAKVRV